MTRQRSVTGFGLLEVVIATALLALLLVLGTNRWQGHVARQRLRYGAAQVAANLRHAQERAKAERAAYTVAFTAASGAYTIARSGGGFVERADLPPGVTAAGTLTVRFSAFGQPSSAYAVTVQNAAGAATVTVSSFGGITYQEP
ncbi:MAG: hypothetical protein QN168_00950 [Armatimonadota bacterium]|nr:hypothetical protein [Armatimonadota bacterium]